MKLFYKQRFSLLFLGMFSMSVLSFSQSADVNIQYLTVGSGGSLYSSSDFDVVYSNNGTTNSRSYFAPCTGMSGSFNALELTVKGGYIDIIRKSNRKIVKIQYVGISGNPGYSSSVVCGVSLDGTTFLNEDYSSDSDWNETVSQPLVYSPNLEDICNDKFFNIPDVIYYYGDDVPISNIRSQVNKIRLIRSDNFAGIALQNNYPTEFCNIKVWFESDPSTGLGEDVADDFTIDRRGNDFILSEAADVCVYSLNGSKIIDSSGVYGFSLDGFSRGAYIIRAKTAKGTISRKIMY